MPHRLIPPLEPIWRAIIALYEPALFYLAVSGAAAATTMVEAGSFASRVNGPWLELVAYAFGSLADLHFRGRAYAKLPPDQRDTRLREWKSRLGLAAIGLAGAVFASLPLHVLAVITAPGMAPALYPLINFACVLVAVPVIDGFRGLFRMLSGQSSQEAFAGLVIGWARRKAQKASEPPAGSA
ncbi:MAG: hypothetical protein ACOC20_06355 [Oceanicaulis sp.]